jgi:hypothetical protein
MNMQWLLVIPGFLAGLIFWPRILRMAYFLIIAAGGNLNGETPQQTDLDRRSALIAVFANSGWIILLSSLAITVLFVIGRVAYGWGFVLIGFYLAPFVIGMSVWRVLTTKKDKNSAAKRRDRLIAWILQHKLSTFVGMTVYVAVPMTIGLGWSAPLRKLPYAFLVSFVGGLFIAALLWFMFLRPLIDGYEYTRRRTGRPE